MLNKGVKSANELPIKADNKENRKTAPANPRRPTARPKFRSITRAPARIAK